HWPLDPGHCLQPGQPGPRVLSLWCAPGRLGQGPPDPGGAVRGMASAGLALLLLLACRATPPAASATLGDLRITNGFAYEPIIQASGAAYFTVKNTGTTPDTLLGVHSSA